MFSYIYSTLTTTSSNKIWLRLMILVMILFIFTTFLTKYLLKPEYTEGFEQQSRFLLKRNCDKYDDFYTNIYETIHSTIPRVNYELQTICSITQANDRSVFLDVGSGTGYLVNQLNDLGFHAYGIDKSKSMIEYSENKYKNANVKCGDVTEPMAYEKSTFSHVLCLYHTIYEIADRAAFFKNCYYWLQPGGYLIIHFVDKTKFNPIKCMNSVDPITETETNNSKSRVINASFDFNDFTYKTNYEIKKTNEMIITETFVDLQTTHVRQNEQTVFIDDLNNMIKLAKQYGFIPQGKINLVKECMDEYQYIYFLERPI